MATSEEHMAGIRRRWWRDCRLIFLNHWTAHSTDPRFKWQCAECGAKWGRA